jgi:hypothetical protein
MSQAQLSQGCPAAFFIHEVREKHEFLLVFRELRALRGRFSYFQ